MINEIYNGEYQGISFSLTSYIHAHNLKREVWIRLVTSISKPELYNLAGKPLQVIESKGSLKVLYQLSSITYAEALQEVKYLIQILNF